MALATQGKWHEQENQHVANALQWHYLLAVVHFIIRLYTFMFGVRQRPVCVLVCAGCAASGDARQVV